MSKRTRDTDYLYASGRIKAMERSFLVRSNLLRLCESGSVAEGIKLLCEWGYLPADSTAEDLQSAFNAVQLTCYRQAGELFPDKRLLDFFRAKYDYHNVKAILKGIASGEDYMPLMSFCGRIAPSLLSSCILEDKYFALPKRLAHAVYEARAALLRSGDPQIVDGYLDREQFRDMEETAKEIGEKYVVEYFKLQVDMQNLRAAVRLARMGADFTELKKYFISGGTVSLNRLLVEITPDTIAHNFTGGYFTEVVSVAGSALRREKGLSELDRAVDDALTAFIKKGKLVAFGVEVPVSYVAAKESELVVLRTIFAGLKVGLAPEKMTERLRETYV